MFKGLFSKIGRWLASDYISEIGRRADKAEEKANQRVAETLAKMDPFEPLMKEFHGIFSETFERPEERLNEKGQLGMKMWAWQQSHDPHFKHMIDWIIDTQGNATMKQGNPTPQTILYGRAQISNMVLFKKEVGRLASLYEEILLKQRQNGDGLEDHAVE